MIESRYFPDTMHICNLIMKRCHAAVYELTGNSTAFHELLMLVRQISSVESCGHSYIRTQCVRRLAVAVCRLLHQQTQNLCQGTGQAMAPQSNSVHARRLNVVHSAMAQET